VALLRAAGFTAIATALNAQHTREGLVMATHKSGVTISKTQQRERLAEAPEIGGIVLPLDAHLRWGGEVLYDWHWVFGDAVASILHWHPLAPAVTPVVENIASMAASWYLKCGPMDSQPNPPPAPSLPVQWNHWALLLLDDFCAGAFLAALCIDGFALRFERPAGSDTAFANMAVLVSAFALAGLHIVLASVASCACLRDSSPDFDHDRSQDARFARIHPGLLADMEAEVRAEAEQKQPKARADAAAGFADAGDSSSGCEATMRKIGLGPIGVSRFIAGMLLMVAIGSALATERAMQARQWMCYAPLATLHGGTGTLKGLRCEDSIKMRLCSGPLSVTTVSPITGMPLVAEMQRMREALSPAGQAAIAAEEAAAAAGNASSGTYVFAPAPAPDEAALGAWRLLMGPPPCGGCPGGCARRATKAAVDVGDSPLMATLAAVLVLYWALAWPAMHLACVFWKAHNRQRTRMAHDLSLFAAPHYATGAGPAALRVVADRAAQKRPAAPAVTTPNAPGGGEVGAVAGPAGTGSPAAGTGREGAGAGEVDPRTEMCHCLVAAWACESLEAKDKRTEARR
jgi:hypothetical protein